ncbi:hypothetical protein [Bradyrhizobium algeriense]|nr:hypothetical protein [Bradyrhizobium algeriense]
MSRLAVWQTKLSQKALCRCHKSDTGREKPHPIFKILSKAQRLI